MAQLFDHDRHTVWLYRLLDRKTRDGLAGVMDQIKRKMLNTRMGIEHFWLMTVILIQISI
jgi:hypothetical protein